MVDEQLLQATVLLLAFREAQQISIFASMHRMTTKTTTYTSVSLRSSNGFRANAVLLLTVSEGGEGRRGLSHPPKKSF